MSASPASAFSVTSGPIPVTSPSEMAIQPVMGLIVLDKGFGFQPLNPSLAQAGSFLVLERPFNVRSHVSQRLDVGGTGVFHQQDVARLRQFNDAAGPADFE